MTLGPSTIVSQSSRTAARVVGGRAVVVVIDTQELHTLNEVGTYVWERATGRPIDAIVNDVMSEFDVSEGRATDDVVRFVEHLVRIGALVVEAA